MKCLLRTRIEGKHGLFLLTSIAATLSTPRTHYACIKFTYVKPLIELVKGHFPF